MSRVLVQIAACWVWLSLSACNSGGMLVPNDVSVKQGAPGNASLDATIANDATVTVDVTIALDVTDALDAAATMDGLSTLRPECNESPPQSLECTGLYSDIASHTISPGLQAFAPAIALWSDGASKLRWVQIPPGTTIDRSNPNDWIFPPGTRFWKEFSLGGHRLETRLFSKQPNGGWVWVSYVWNADETAAIAAPDGQTVALSDGGTWKVPSQRQCSQCHNGRVEHVLGFEEASLGLSGATGLTLSKLAEQGLLSPAPGRTSLSIGDDGTGRAAPALGWIHINCGVSCHNSNTTSSAGSLIGMRLRLDAMQLDGRPPGSFDPIVTTVNVLETSIFWPGQTRIVPGSPDNSLLVQLISRREAGNQMPPLGSQIVDMADVAIVRQWVQGMTTPVSDGGSTAEIPLDSGSNHDPEDRTDGSLPSDGPSTNMVFTDAATAG